MDSVHLLSLRREGQDAKGALIFTAVLQLDRAPDDNEVEFVAPAPVHRNHSFSGSGLPFANVEQAFHATPNRGRASVSPDRTFMVRLLQPAAYYVGLGTVRIQPTLHVVYMAAGTRRVASVLLPACNVPFRSLTYPGARSDAGFYDNEESLVRSQEQILFDSMYKAPEITSEPADFWGARPPR